MNRLNYVPGNSFLHRLNPVTKLLAAFMYGIAAILCENVFAEVGFIILMALMIFLVFNDVRKLIM